MTMPKFTPTISVGNLLTVVLIALGGIWYVATLERDLTNNITELRGDVQAQVMRIDGRINMTNGLHKTEFAAVRRDLAKILVTLDRLADQRSK